MSSKECETQLNELLEAWDLDEATLNQTDIEAIKHLLLENQMQQDVIISYKTTNLDQAVDIQQLEQENKQLKAKLEMYENGIYYSSENDKLKEIIEEVKELKDEYVCSEEYCGEVGIKTTDFIIKLGQILDKIKGEKNG